MDRRHILLIMAIILVSGALVTGCSNSSNLVELTLSEENIDYLGHAWNSQQQLIEYCVNIENNQPCVTEDGNIIGCPSLGLVQIGYELKDVPSEHVIKVGCSAFEDGDKVLEKSFIEISKVVPITTTYTEDHTFEICCKIDTEEARSNEVCFTQEIVSICKQ